MTAGKKRQGKPIWSKIQLLTSCTYTHVYVCCIQISHISLESNPRQCDKNSCLKKNTQPSSPHGHMSTALGMRLEALEQGLLTLATPFPLPDVHTSTPPSSCSYPVLPLPVTNVNLTVIAPPRLQGIPGHQTPPNFPAPFLHRKLD